MKILNISKKTADHLPALDLSQIISTEGTFYHLPVKRKWNKEDLLFKKFYDTTSAYFSSKIFTILSLIESQEQAVVDSFVYPRCAVAINEKISGFAMPFINGTNLGLLLKSPDVPFKTKIGYIRQICELLIEMEKVRKYTSLKDFYINDLHEFNFMVEKDTGVVRTIDLDSVKINGNTAFHSMYIRNYDRIMAPKNKFGVPMVAYETTAPSADTDIYCLCTMLLNLLYQDRILFFDIEKFYTYLTYLNGLGYDKELLDLLSKLYVKEVPNVNPIDYLETIKFNPRASGKVFERVLKK